MSGRKWRHMENKILREYFGTVRQLQETQSVGTSCDGYTNDLALELGTHDIPKWLWQELQQAIDHSRGKIPVAVIHEKGTPYDDSIVILRLEDFCKAYVLPPELQKLSDTVEFNPASAINRLRGYVLCPCGDKLIMPEQVQEHRERGHFEHRIDRTDRTINS